MAIAFESEEAARVWVWKMNYEVFMGESASMTFVQNMEFDSFRLPDNLEMFTRYELPLNFKHGKTDVLVCVIALGLKLRRVCRPAHKRRLHRCPMRHLMLLGSFHADDFQLTQVIVFTHCDDDCHR